MKNYVLISAYFGKFPRHFNLWLKSAEQNRNIDFFIYGDCNTDNLTVPENVKFIHISFDEMKSRIQNKFDFEIVLDAPYKLCDYKPAYGYIFEEDITEYKYWGHIDIDTILGDIEKYLPEKEYYKIYKFGHLCLYRNTFDNNRKFMAEGGQDYKNVFSTSFITVFDELPGMNKKFDLLGIEQYSSNDFADIARRRKNFTLNSEICRKNYKYQIFYYDNGRIFRDYFDCGKMNTDEFNYIHFSHRSPEDKTDGADSFYITRFGCIKKDGETTLDIIKKYNAPTPVQNIFCAINTQIIRRIKRYFKLMYYKISKG